MGTSHAEAIATIERRPAGGSTELSIDILRHDRCVIEVVSEASDFELVLWLLRHDRLMARQGGLAADAAIRAIVADHGSGGRLVRCCRVWVLVGKWCPVIGS